MDIVRTKSHYYQNLMLDQCPECGGIWVDEGELYQIQKGEARIIETKNMPKLKKSLMHDDRPAICPRHKIPMLTFRDPNFPSNIPARKCPICHNLFFERGDLTKWQAYVIRRWPTESDRWVGRVKK